MNYPNSLKNLIESFKLLPGIGEKTAERLSLAVLALDEEKTQKFSNSINDVKTKIKRCPICHTLTEDEICNICKDDCRNTSILCVVEQPKDVILFENIGTFTGRYHVLDGLISPLDGVNPEDLHITDLVERVQRDNIKEIVIAVTPSIEGETTALYISKLFEGTDVVVSKIAHGVPLGTNMEYIDALTLELALEDRKKISN